MEQTLSSPAHLNVQEAVKVNATVQRPKSLAPVDTEGECFPSHRLSRVDSRTHSLQPPAGVGERWQIPTGIFVMNSEKMYSNLESGIGLV